MDIFPALNIIMCLYNLIFLKVENAPHFFAKNFKEEKFLKETSPFYIILDVLFVILHLF
jgi:hypothetical protein